MNNRLKQFLAAENITQAQFADTINVVRASVSHVLSGRNNPSFDFIKAMMEKYPKLNIEWLMFGRGKMYKEFQPQPQAQAEPDILFPEDEATDIDSGIEGIVHTVTNMESEPSSIELRTLKEVPQQPVKQRKVSKIFVLFDDGTYQEM